MLRPSSLRDASESLLLKQPAVQWLGGCNGRCLSLSPVCAHMVQKYVVCVDQLKKSLQAFGG